MKNLAVFALALVSISSAMADDSLSAAFKSCLNQATTIESTPATETVPAVHTAQVKATKVGVDGTSNSVVQLSCVGSRAEALFQSAGRYSTEGQKPWSDGSVVISRKFGHLDVNSQCNRRIRDSEGRESNYYWCNIIIDLTSDFTKALNL